MITTMDRYEQDQTKNGLVDISKKAGTVKEYQKVIAIGPMVRNIEVGDTVFIDPSAYGRPVHKEDENSVAGLTKTHVEMTYDLPVINMNGVDYLFISDRDIEFVADVEEVSDTLYVPPKPSLIVN